MPACVAGATPEGLGNFSPLIDLTQVPTVVNSGVPGPLPKGVTGLTTYNTKYAGLATRGYNASWGDPSGTAGLEWTPDNDSLYYFKYGRGYKSGGYNIGIFTVLSFSPYTAAEHVNSFELGAKHTFGHWLTADFAAFYYSYSDLQIPIGQVQTAGGLAQSETSFYNVPSSVSKGIELETTFTPIDHLSILFNYSYLNSTISKGTAADPADPNALEPGARPILSPAKCAASVGTTIPGACSADVYSKNGNPLGIADPYAGFNVPQNLAGNPLPNAPKNKIAINVLYDYKTDSGVKIDPSVSYVWRDKEWGLFFKDPSGPRRPGASGTPASGLARRMAGSRRSFSSRTSPTRSATTRAPSPPARQAPWTSRTAPAASRRSTTSRASTGRRASTTTSPVPTSSASTRPST